MTTSAFLDTNPNGRADNLRVCPWLGTKQAQEFPALLDVPVDDWFNLCEQRREVVRETMRVPAHS
jgi:hypothetical protein